MDFLNKFSLKGKTALVTGCKRGIGKGMAVALAAAGADIIGVSASLEPKGSEVEKEVKALGRNFKGYTCDFSDRDALYDLIMQVLYCANRQPNTLTRCGIRLLLQMKQLSLF